MMGRTGTPCGGECGVDEELHERVREIIRSIPRGRVASYGQLAALIGCPRNARLVARVLSSAELYCDYPCHRVVNSAGRTAPHWPEQPLLLREEGVPFCADGRVDMKSARWEQT